MHPRTGRPIGKKPSIKSRLELPLISKLFARAIGLLKSTHPIPSFAVTSFTVLLAIGYGMPLEKLFLVGFGILFQQFSVGLSNDWLDYERDKTVGRNDKPTVRFEVSAKLVRNASLVSAVIALVFAMSLGWKVLLTMVAMLVVGWSYNLGLKSSALSALPYAVGFGIVPVFVTLSLSTPQLPLWWVMVAAGLLGVAAHFANALPDLMDDRETGVRALPHMLGQRISALAISGAAAFASLLVVTQSASLNPTLAWLGFGLTMSLVVAASVLALRPKPPRVIFHLLIAAAFVNVALLVLG
jgi:4-hydroxybenzoate polyprenyltransferase